MNDTQWWLLSPEPDFVAWARLRLREDGTFDLLEASGLSMRFDDADAARHFMLSAEYRAFDGLDADDAEALGCALDQLSPPVAPEGDELLAAMTQFTGRRR